MNTLAKRITLFFGLWMLFLIVIGLFLDRSPIFFDIVSQQDVSDQYTSIITWNRILFEPFIGPIYAIFADYSLDLWVVLSIVTIYPLGRLIIVILGRNLPLSEYPELSKIRRYVKFSVDLTSILLLFVFISIGIYGFILRSIWGLVAYERYFNRVLDIFMLIGGGLSLSIIIFIPSILPRRKKPIPATFSMIRRIPIRKVMKELKIVAEFFLVLAIFSINMLSAPLPTQKYVTNLASGEMLLDFHVHTTISNAYMTPEERVEWYISQGIHGAAFSDRLAPEGSLRAQKYVTNHHLDFLVIVTQEYIAIEPRIHLNIYGLTESIMPIDYINDPLVENPMNVSDMIHYVKNQGGFVTVNHYIGNTNEPAFPLESLRDWGVDGFEVTNAGRELDPSIRTFCLANNLAILAGTDEHANQEVNAFARLRLPDPSNRSLSAIFTELKKNLHQVVLVEHYPERFGWVDILNPIKMTWKFTNYLLNLSFAQWSAWILWSIAGYLTILHFTKQHESLSSK